MADDHVTVSAFLRAGDATTASPMIAALRTMLSGPRAIPGWRLQPPSPTA